MFPASAGMIPRRVLLSIIIVSVPRIRGDDPYTQQQITELYECSPHPRG